MEFPIYLRFGSLNLHPHWVFESLAYFLGFSLFLLLRKHYGDPISSDARWWIITAAIVGAAIGSKLLYAMISNTRA